MNLDLVFTTNTQASRRWAYGREGGREYKDEDKLVGARKQTDILWRHPPSLRAIVVNGPYPQFSFAFLCISFRESFASNNHPYGFSYSMTDKPASRPHGEWG
jgi:hypothetical protein